MQKANPESHRPLNLGRWLPYRMFIVAARVAELLSLHYSRRYGLSQAAWRVLAVIGDRPGMSAREIQHAAGLDQFAVSRAIGLLRKLSFADRSNSDRDRRRAEVVLTALGREALDSISRVALHIEQELLADIPPKERADLDKLLARIDSASLALTARGLIAASPDIQAKRPTSVRGRTGAGANQ